jgi:hypothetical protein
VTARRRIRVGERRARLAQRHRLTTPTRTDDVAAIAESVVALHSSDPATVYLSATARMRHPSIDAVSKALYDDRTVVRHHAMRRTLWVFTPEVARIAHAACTEALAVNQRRLLAKMVEDSGVAEDGAAWARTAKAETLAALASMGPATAREVGKKVPRLTDKLQLIVAGRTVNTQSAHTRLLLGLGFDGAVIRGRPSGGWNASEYPWSVAEQWLPGGLTGADPQTAAAELARRYLDRFGPATTADLQWWAGWTAGATKRAIAAVGAVAVDIEGADGVSEGWVLPDDNASGSRRSPSWVAFLPALDPTTMGWKDRSWYLGEHGKFGNSLFDSNGNAGPTIWVDGQVVGGWAQRKSGEIAYRLLGDVPASRARAIAARAEEIRTLIGPVRVNVRFPAPMQKELLA